MSTGKIEKPFSGGKTKNYGAPQRPVSRRRAGAENAEKIRVEADWKKKNARRALGSPGVL
jgi:hypothetical protein